MTIKANVDFGVYSLLLADNTVVDFNSLGVDRYSVTVASLFNTTAASITVGVYISPDNTSASGVFIGEYVVPAIGGGVSQVDINSIMGQGYTENIILVPDAVGVNSDLSGNTYADGD
jgi:hypothetical protein